MTVTIRKYKRGGWEVDIRIAMADGKEVRERRKAPVSTKDQALRWGRDRERVLLTRPEEKALPRKEVPTLEGFFPVFMAGYAKQQKRLKHSGIVAKESLFKNYLVSRLGKKRLDEITNGDVLRLIESMESLNPKTVNNVLTLLNTIQKYAVKSERLDQRVFTIELLGVSKAERAFYDFDVYERLVEGAFKVGDEVGIAVLLGGDAGFRASEIIGVEWGDFDLTRSLLRVRNAEVLGVRGEPKGGLSDWLPMTFRLRDALKAHRHLRGPRVLYRADGQTVSWKSLRLWMEKAERRAGLPVTGRVHILRHSFISHLAMRGVPARSIQELARHKDLSTTQQYMHLSPMALRSAIEMLEAGRGAASVGDIVETATPITGSGRF